MKRYVIGIDAGGSKTAFALGDLSGRMLSSAEGPGCNIYQYAPEAMIAALRGGLEALAAAEGLRPEDVAGIAAGMPVFGEGADADRRIREVCAAAFGSVPYTVVNDGLIACCGALGGKPGVNVVAGTGSIAFGMDPEGHIARCGGWSEHFSDEGSCYWMGREAMALFCREADERVPRGALYDLIRTEYGLKYDFDFVPLMERDVLPVRKKVAALQLLLLRAADAGDEEARVIYARAAEKLASLAVDTAKKLHFTQAAEASMTGGALHAMRYMRDSWAETLEKNGLKYHEAEGSPVQGALLLAVRQYG